MDAAFATRKPTTRGLDAYERNFARQQRANRMSWGSIAQQLGRCEHDIRLAIDSSYDDGSGRPPPARQALALGENYEFLQRLAASRDFVRTSELPDYPSQTVSRLRRRYGEDIVEGRRGLGYRITERGREVLANRIARLKRELGLDA